MEKVEACPSVEELKQLMLGQIADRAADALERHLAECPCCSKILNSLKLEMEGTPIENIRQGTGARWPEKEVVDNLIGQLKQIPVEVAPAQFRVPSGPSKEKLRLVNAFA